MKKFFNDDEQLIKLTSEEKHKYFKQAALKHKDILDKIQEIYDNAIYS